MIMIGESGERLIEVMDHLTENPKTKPFLTSEIGGNTPLHLMALGERWSEADHLCGISDANPIEKCQGTSAMLLYTANEAIDLGCMMTSACAHATNSETISEVLWATDDVDLSRTNLHAAVDLGWVHFVKTLVDKAIGMLEAGKDRFEVLAPFGHCARLHVELYTFTSAAHLAVANPTASRSNIIHELARLDPIGVACDLKASNASSSIEAFAKIEEEAIKSLSDFITKAHNNEIKFNSPVDMGGRTVAHAVIDMNSMDLVETLFPEHNAKVRARAWKQLSKVHLRDRYAFKANSTPLHYAHFRQAVAQPQPQTVQTAQRKEILARIQSMEPIPSTFDPVQVKLPTGSVCSKHTLCIEDYKKDRLYLVKSLRDVLWS